MSQTPNEILGSVIDATNEIKKIEDTLNNKYSRNAKYLELLTAKQAQAKKDFENIVRNLQ